MAKKGVEVVVEALKTPVMGFDRTVTYTKKGKTVIETGRFQIRAWELGLGAVVAWIWLGGLQGLVNAGTGNGNVLSPSGAPWNIWDGFIGGIIQSIGAGSSAPTGETMAAGGYSETVGTPAGTVHAELPVQPPSEGTL